MKYDLNSVYKSKELRYTDTLVQTNCDFAIEKC